ncbi:hypothetical protein DV515_00005427, partial [Chloebia gouldiae]
HNDLWNMSDDKPFLCTAPGCGQRFTNEDHLAVHKHKHEMTLKFGPARNDSVIVADQTPTPTRFLKNCEEVGLFNELASPFENEFKKASEDDIKKMPLDLSPLATPIIRNKIEEPSVVETTHQDSPLPHPESTTNDEKEVSLQQTAQPTSTIVRPASLQVPNVLLTSSDSSVIIQQAIPSPTSSTVITQAPSSNRPIVPVPGPFPLLLHLPNGQTMPVAIPASITNSNVHVPAAVPLVRPVTMVPSIPGIPGPSSPQPVQSEAKLNSNKDDSSEDISVPSSPHTEAIQHSSVSTSNGVSSTSKAEAVATSVLTQMADQSTEPVLSQIVLAPPSQAQPSGIFYILQHIKILREEDKEFDGRLFFSAKSLVLQAGFPLHARHHSAPGEGGTRSLTAVKTPAEPACLRSLC